MELEESGKANLNGVVSKSNPLLDLELDFDPHHGTPVDLLHTVLLGTCSHAPSELLFIYRALQVCTQDCKIANEVKQYSGNCELAVAAVETSFCVLYTTHRIQRVFAFRILGWKRTQGFLAESLVPVSSVSSCGPADVRVTRVADEITVCQIH
jgi:hypothetical protein